MTRILIADTHQIYREALCAYLGQAEEGFELTATQSEEDLKKIFALEDIDIVIAEDKFSAFLDNAPTSVKTAVIAGPDFEQEKGGHSYHGIFTRGLSSREILRGIGDIMRGRVYRPAMARLPVSNTPPSMGRANPDSLIAAFNFTEREKEVLQHLTHGKTNKEIARALDLQVVTIKLHVRGVCRKMKATNRTQAALMAKEYGWGR